MSLISNQWVHFSVSIDQATNSISFFENGNKESFINSLKNSKDRKPLSKDERYSITLDHRANKLINFIY